MPRIDHTPVAEPGPIDYDGAVITMLAADTTNDEQATWTGRELIIAHNTGLLAHTVTITSIADDFGRTRNVAAVSMAADEYRCFGRFSGSGWKQIDGKLYFEADHAEIKFGVIRLSN